MRVVIFRHVPFEGPGFIHPILEERGVSVAFADLYRNDPLPDLSAASGLIFMGGPMSANDDLPYLSQEMEAIRRAAARGQPVLGVCLGAQLIAKALGARVFRNPVKEIGWFDVRLTDAGRADSVLREMAAPGENVFHWHGETFDLPEGATWLAYSDACRHQAFRAGSNIYGLQFHLEVTPEMIGDWCSQDANCGDVRDLKEPIDPHRNAARMAQLSRLVFGRWSSLLI